MIYDEFTWALHIVCWQEVSFSTLLPKENYNMQNIFKFSIIKAIPENKEVLA